MVISCCRKFYFGTNFLFNLSTWYVNLLGHFFTSFQMRFYFFFNHFLFHLIFVLSSLFHPFDTTCKFLHCRPFKLGMLSAFEVEMLSFEVPTLRCFQGFVQIYKYKFKFKYKYIFAFGFPASVAKISVLLLPRGN